MPDTAPTDVVTILGIAGSLRKGSLNKRLLEAARELAPPTLQIQIVSIADIPLYNADLDTDHARPADVIRLKQACAEADGLLLVSPEYNHTVPGVMQNTIDWMSRPGMKSPMAGKPCGIMGASPGAIGTARGQQQLKLTLLSTLALVMPHAGVTVSLAAEKFGPTGALTDERTRQFVAAYLKQFEAFVRQHATRTKNEERRANEEVVPAV